MVSLILPFGDGLAQVDEDVEEGVHEEDAVGSNATRVEQYGFWRPVEGVGVQAWLDHDQGVGAVLFVQNVPVIRGLVGGIVEYLSEKDEILYCDFQTFFRI